MARQLNMKIIGTIDGLTLYKSQDGYLVRQKNSVTKKMIAEDPEFTAFRDSGREFTAVVAANKLLRDTLCGLMDHVADGSVTARLNQVMSAVLKFDKKGARGERVPALGFDRAEGRALLKGFDFNQGVDLYEIVAKPYVLDLDTGGFMIKDLVPVEDIVYPRGATHVRFLSAFARVNFATGVSDMTMGCPVLLKLDGLRTSVESVPVAPPSGDGIRIYLLKVELLQCIHGLYYPVKKGASNVLSIIEVAGV